MVRSIDPRRETIRGAQRYSDTVAPLFGARVAETILASGHGRPHQQAGHMNASDPIIQAASSCKQGAVHICHMLHDRPEHKRRRWATLFRRRAMGDLFGGPYA